MKKSINILLITASLLLGSGISAKELTCTPPGLRGSTCTIKWWIPGPGHEEFPGIGLKASATCGVGSHCTLKDIPEDALTSKTGDMAEMMKGYGVN